MTETPDDVVRTILDDAFQRYRTAEAKYGVIDVQGDRRDFLIEAEEELLDMINYATFQIARLRYMRERLKTCTTDERSI